MVRLVPIVFVIAAALSKAQATSPTLVAYRAADRAQQNDPHNPEILKSWLNLAAVLAGEAAHLIDEGKYDAALVNLSAVQRPLNNSASWNNLIGYAEFKLQQPDEAQSHLRRALALDPNNESYLLDMTDFLSSHHAYKEAIAFLEVGQKRIPNSIPIRFTLALNQLFDQQLVKATASLEQLHAEHPELVYVSHALGEAYEAAENWGAMVTFGRALQVQYPNLAMGWYLEGAGLAHAATDQNASRSATLHALQRAVELDPSSARYHFQLGKECEVEHDYPHAIDELRAAIRINPQHERAHYVLATVYKKIGDTKLASEQFQLHEAIKTKGLQDAYSAMEARTRTLGVETGEKRIQ